MMLRVALVILLLPIIIYAEEFNPLSADLEIGPFHVLVTSDRTEIRDKSGIIYYEAKDFGTDHRDSLEGLKPQLNEVRFLIQSRTLILIDPTQKGLWEVQLPPFYEIRDFLGSVTEKGFARAFLAFKPALKDEFIGYFYLSSAKQIFRLNFLIETEEIFKRRRADFIAHIERSLSEASESNDSRRIFETLNNLGSFGLISQYEFTDKIEDLMEPRVSEAKLLAKARVFSLSIGNFLMKFEIVDAENDVVSLRIYGNDKELVYSAAASYYGDSARDEIERLISQDSDFAVRLSVEEDELVINKDRTKLWRIRLPLDFEQLLFHSFSDPNYASWVRFSIDKGTFLLAFLDLEDGRFYSYEMKPNQTSEQELLELKRNLHPSIGALLRGDIEIDQFESRFEPRVELVSSEVTQAEGLHLNQADSNKIEAEKSISFERPLIVNGFEVQFVPRDQIHQVVQARRQSSQGRSVKVRFPMNSSLSPDQMSAQIKKIIESGIWVSFPNDPDYFFLISPADRRGFEFLIQKMKKHPAFYLWSSLQPLVAFQNPSTGKPLSPELLQALRDGGIIPEDFRDLLESDCSDLIRKLP